jgi:hypothetical protein
MESGFAESDAVGAGGGGGGGGVTVGAVFLGQPVEITMASSATTSNMNCRDLSFTSSSVTKF